MWLVGASLMLSVLVANSFQADSKQLCQQPVLPPNVIFSHPGANVTLRCLEKTLPNSTVVHWKFKGRNLSSNPARQAVPGPILFLPAVVHNDSGHYSCYAGQRFIQSLRLVVEEPLEVPDSTCFRRSFSKGIICEWKPSRPVSSHVKAHLWVTEGFMGGNYTKFQCRYYMKSQKFTCHIARLHSDNILQVFMCAHTEGQATSRKQFLWPNSLLKPDPPINVTMNSVEKAPQRLLVTWQYPPSWGSRFYDLKFQLRYRAEIASKYSQVELSRGATSYTINDALKSVRHVVQVRGREEFDHGSWSEWSRESSRTPWTEPFNPELETTSYVSKFPYDFYFDSTDPTNTPLSPGDQERPAVEDVAIIPLHTFLIMALSVIVGFALAVGIILRYRKRWRSSGEGKQGKGPSLTLTPVAPSPPLSASPLLSPPASPISESSVDSPGVLDHNLYDISNADYFLLPQ
ncbi:interleukin-6 receptor subunit alpha [Tiliqua scincoides]|uniref:interleukin-6 receptor subunit alpha n=1 Tax=Tiliqua scincoides TaxID=71010 RepID=UPI003462B7B5